MVEVEVVLVQIVRLEVAGDLAVSMGPVRERMTGKRTSPWNSPNTTVRQNTLKKVMKT